MSFRLASRFSGSLGARWSETVNEDQWHSNVGAPGAEGTRYTFARLEQTTVSLTSRLNYTFTPSLTLQVYAQPYVSTGRYTDWKELADPRAKRLANRYVPYESPTGAGPGGFRFMQFRSNTVLRWEYRPGSTLFLVWAQGRQAYEEGEPWQFDSGRDPRALFERHPDNTLLLKVAYWLNP